MIFAFSLTYCVILDSHVTSMDVSLLHKWGVGVDRERFRGDYVHGSLQF